MNDFLLLVLYFGIAFFIVGLGNLIAGDFGMIVGAVVCGLLYWLVEWA